MINRNLLDILVCPVTKSKLYYNKESNELISLPARLAYKIKDDIPIMKSVRGKGLLNAIVLDCDENSEIPWNICLDMRDNGLIAKPTQGNKIRFAPPLVISENQLKKALLIIENSLRKF